MASRPLDRPITGLYDALLQAYGPQGWWPLPSRAGRRGFDKDGYHAGDYLSPKTAAGRFEVCLGAVLTQNTAWTNVETALEHLRREGIRTPDALLACSEKRLAGLIRSSGYYNMKAKKLRVLASLLGQPRAHTLTAAPSRETLLSLWGVGPETADSILLYAFRVPVFVVDAYTRRILARIGLIAGHEPYCDIQALFHAALPRHPELYNEFHALLVEHAKRHCRVKPLCEGCSVPACRHRDGTA